MSADKVNFIKNFFSLSIVQGLNYLLPLITLPYLVRILGAEKFGILSLATAVVAFLVVFTDYGFNYTATREISLNKNNTEELIKIFSSVMIIKFILLFISLLILLVLLVTVSKFNQNYVVYLLTFGVVLGQVLFPVWFFQGIEKMKFITAVNVFSKTLAAVCIFIFIKKADDYYWVPILTSLGSILGGLYSLILVKREFGIIIKLQPFYEIIKHLKGGWHLSLTSFISTLLTSSGILILGFFASNHIVGLYAAIEKLFKAIIGMFLPITQALYPISCKYFNKNDNDGGRYLIRLFVIMLLCSTVVAFLVAFNSSFIILNFYGSNLLRYSYILQIMMIWLVFSVVNNVIGIQYLCARKKDKFYTLAFIISGLITVLLNLALIPRIGINGILYATIFGEIILTLAMLIFIRGKKL
ncbi:flippase [Acinetobacter ursingii]|uniref:flippase n=1 Tax=Acinetobacter ursingii TaxID=108980 RepID=UPI001D17BBFD|nr:flippase [Acinetobacter ursingii]